MVKRKAVGFHYGWKFTTLLSKDIRQWCAMHYPEEKIENKTEEELLAIISKYQGALYFLEECTS